MNEARDALVMCTMLNTNMSDETNLLKKENAISANAVRRSISTLVIMCHICCRTVSCCCCCYCHYHWSCPAKSIAVVNWRLTRDLLELSVVLAIAVSN
jgi:hypothetical protein